MSVIHMECLPGMRMFPDNMAHSVVTDPPYGLRFMGKRWDYDVPSVEEWREAYRLLRPGGYLLAFGGTRTYHRLVCAIEDAGFEIRDQIGWAFGSGFPKSHNGEWGGTALKPAWEPICVARKPLEGTVEENWRKWGTGALAIDACRVETSDSLGGGAYAKNPTEREQMWGADAGNSWVRGGAGEFVQPDGRWPANLIHDGSDEVLAAFPTAPGQMAKASTSDTQRAGQNTYGNMVRGSNGSEPRNDAGSAARFFQTCQSDYTDDLWQDLNLPSAHAATVDANSLQQRRAVFFVLVHVAKKALPEGLLWDVSLSKEPTTPATPTQLRALATALTQTIRSIDSRYWLGLLHAKFSLNLNHVQSVVLRTQTGTTTITLSHWLSDGSAEPVTFNITPQNLGVGERVSALSSGVESARFKYCAKASKSDRNEGLEGRTPRNEPAHRKTNLDATADNPYLRGVTERLNTHPTVKPTALMRYLCRLVTPAGGLVIDPWAGSGSTGKAAVLEGFGFLGFEREAEHVEIANARIAHARSAA
jgi:DNA modification methylase